MSVLVSTIGLAINLIDTTMVLLEKNLAVSRSQRENPILSEPKTAKNNVKIEEEEEDGVVDSEKE
jgi:hypothetical protein